MNHYSYCIVAQCHLTERKFGGISLRLKDMKVILTGNLN